MANIEKITYKGDVYDISDAKAMHQDAAGSWMPDFDALKPIETHEWTIATTATGVICERANFADINDARDVLAFRITVDASSGTSIHQVADVIVRLQPTANVTPLVMVINRSRSTSAANTGFRYLYAVYPKAANTDYKYQLAIYPYNATSRKVKVEVFKKTDAWTFADSRTAYSYNSDYQTRNDMTIYTSLGVICNYTQYMTTSYSNYAGYISSWLPYFNSSYSELTTGAAVSASQLCFIGEDGKAYPASNTTAAVDTAYPPFYASSAVSNATAMTWSYVRRFGVVTIPTSIGRDTLAAGKPVYMRCTNSNGKVYSANKMTHDLTTGYTYVKIGRMHSSTVTCFDTYNSQYFTVNNDRITRLNNIPLEAELAAAIDRQLYIAQTGNYGVLLDNNQITDLTTPTMSPKVAGTLTFNPSTGNLSSILFSGSGAGLTNVPASSLTGVVPLSKGGTGVSVTTNDTWYDENGLHPRFEVIYDDIDGGFQVLYSGPLDNITNISDFYNSEYFRMACRSLAPIWAGTPNTTFLGSGIVFTGAFIESDITKIYIVFPDGIHFGNVIVNGLKGSLTTEVIDGVVTSVFMDPESMLPSFPAWTNQIPIALSDLNDDMGVGTMVASDNVLFGTCSSAATDTTKVITISNSSYEIKAGTRILVWFYNVSDTPTSGTISISIDNVSYTVYIYRPVGDAAASTISLVAPYFKCKRFLNFYISGDNPQRAYIIPDTDVYLKSPYQKNGRPNSMNVETSSCAYVQHLCATSQCVTGKPVINGATCDSHVLHFNWDNSAAYSAQLAIQDGSSLAQGGMAYRRQTGVTNGWYPWKTLIDEDNIASYLPSTVELNTNKVTSVSSSSTDTEYPSAKAVYDAISGISPGGGAGDDCYYGYCGSSATTPKKVVTISNSGYTITDHVRLFVYFNSAHTYSSSKPYLSIDDVTYNIRYYDLSISAEESTSMINNILYNRRYMEFYFMTMSGSLTAIALPDNLPTLFSPYRTNNTRITNLNNFSTANGAYMKYVIASSNTVTTGKPKINGADASAMILHMNWDNNTAYAAQLALQVGSTTVQGGMAYRRQNGQSNGWYDWKTLADEDNIGTLTDVEHCYTAALTPAGNGTIVFPIDGTKYKVTQITLINFDTNATAGFGFSRMFVAVNGGSGGYQLGTSDYFGLASTSTDITMTISSSSSSGMQDSTNLHAQVRYVKL